MATLPLLLKSLRGVEANTDSSLRITAALDRWFVSKIANTTDNFVSCVRGRYASRWVYVYCAIHVRLDGPARFLLQ